MKIILKITTVDPVILTYAPVTVGVVYICIYISLETKEKHLLSNTSKIIFFNQLLSQQKIFCVI